MRVRRLAVVVTLALAAGSALTGCRSEPDVAVYYGDQKVSVARVDAIVKGVNDEADRRLTEWGRARAENPNTLPPAFVHTNGAEVVSLIVLADLGRRVIRQQGLGTRVVPADTIAETFGMPATDTYVTLWVDYLSGLQSVAAAEQARPLTEEEADRLYDAGAADPDADYDDAIHQLRSTINLAPLLDAQRRLAGAMGAARVSVNPRYGPVVLPVVLDGRHLEVGFADEVDEATEEG
jgi:hypothetical protein